MLWCASSFLAMRDVACHLFYLCSNLGSGDHLLRGSWFHRAGWQHS